MSQQTEPQPQPPYGSSPQAMTPPAEQARWGVPGAPGSGWGPPPPAEEPPAPWGVPGPYVTHDTITPPTPQAPSPQPAQWGSPPPPAGNPWDQAAQAPYQQPQYQPPQPTPDQWGQQPSWGPPQSPQRRPSRFSSLPLGDRPGLQAGVAAGMALLLVIIVIGAVLGGGSKHKTQAAAAKPPATSSKAPNFGTTTGGGGAATARPPAAYCKAVASVDSDFSKYLTSDGKSPSQSQLTNDGFKLGQQAAVAGDPYRSEVLKFSQASQNGGITETVKDLDQIEQQCGQPLTQIPGEAS